MTPIARKARGDFTLNIQMDAPHSIVFFAVPQFPLVPTGITNYEFFPQSPTGDNWFDSNSEVQINYPRITQTENAKQTVIRWTLDNNEIHLVKEGSSELLSTGAIKMTSPHKVDFAFKNQYKVDVISDVGQTFGGGWHDENSEISIGVESTGTFGQSFEGWDGIDSADNPTTILVDSPKKITAKWSTDYGVITIPVIIGAAALGIISYKKRPRKAPKIEPAFTKAVGVPDEKYDSEVAKFLKTKVLEEIDAYLVGGTIDEARLQRLKESIKP
jgi:hypothetical protein